jgi:hypothetical protein
MELEHLRDLLKQAQRFAPLEREMSIFSIAGRGYFENPTTDLLAFFLDPAKGHGLGDCFLSALLGCLPDTEQLTASLRRPPQREVTTPQGNRIDLLLRGDDWDLVLENKIFHGQVNPFEDYERYAKTKLGENGRRVLYTILSPSGKSVKQSWHGLSYSQLIMAIRLQLGQRVMTQPLDKWQVFAREFLLHLENITVEQAMDAKAVSFVFDHLHQINKLTKLKEQVINILDKKILDRLDVEVPGYQRATRRHNWENGPVLRYYSSNWSTRSDVALYLSGAKEQMTPHVRVYLFAMTTELEERGRQLFFDNECKIWHENNRSILAIDWRMDSYKEDEVLSRVTEKMRLLMQFESEIRTSVIKNEKSHEPA